MSTSRYLFMLALLIIIISALVAYVLGHVYLVKKITRERYENVENPSWPDIGLESSASSEQNRPRPPSEVIDRMEKELTELEMIKGMLLSETQTQLVEQTKQGVESTKQELVESTRQGIKQDAQQIMQEKIQEELQNLESVKEKLRS